MIRKKKNPPLVATTILTGSFHDIFLSIYIHLEKKKYLVKSENDSFSVILWFDEVFFLDVHYEDFKDGKKIREIYQYVNPLLLQTIGRISSQQHNTGATFWHFLF